VPCVLPILARSLGWIPADSHQYVAFRQTFEGIQPEKFHSRMAYVGQVDDVCAIEPEVIRLRLGPRIKQRHKVARFGIDRANVAALPADCTLCRTMPGYRVLYALHASRR